MKLHNRIAPDGDGGLYLDMVDGFGSVIHVNENRWRVDKPEKPIFRNYNHQLALPDPLKGGEVKEILAFVNIRDRYNQILYLSALICCFIPEIEHPIFNVFGPYGSGKSSVLRVAKTFIDPSITDLLILNRKDEKELIKNLDDSYCVFFDNISYLTQDISDLLCKAVTGAGFSVRRLWTNNESFIRQFMRVIGLNGINIPAERGDLLSRCINIETMYLEEDEVIPRELYDKTLKERTPYILHAILDTIVKTLRIKQTVKVDGLSRLGDFTIWGYAAAQALGYDPQDFLRAYKENMGEGSIDAVAISPVGTLVKEFLERRSDEFWEGQPQELWKEFYQLARDLNMSTSQNRFPKGANALSRELNKLSPDLRKLGYLYTTRRTGKARYIKLEVTKHQLPGQPSLDKYTGDDAPKPRTGKYPQDLKTLFETLRRVEKEKGEAVKEQDLYEACKSQRWFRDYFDKLLLVLMREGTVYAPRPGFYRVTG